MLVVLQIVDYDLTIVNYIINLKINKVYITLDIYEGSKLSTRPFAPIGRPARCESSREPGRPIDANGRVESLLLYEV